MTKKLKPVGEKVNYFTRGHPSCYCFGIYYSNRRAVKKVDNVLAPDLLDLVYSQYFIYVYDTLTGE